MRSRTKSTLSWSSRPSLNSSKRGSVAVDRIWLLLVFMMWRRHGMACTGMADRSGSSTSYQPSMRGGRAEPPPAL